MHLHVKVREKHGAHGDELPDVGEILAGLAQEEPKQAQHRPGPRIFVTLSSLGQFQ